MTTLSRALGAAILSLSAARRAGVTQAELDALVAAQRAGATNHRLEAMSEVATS
ncbi:MAG: hypothetical protein L0G22_01560 [Propionibacteriaceae bacterium]|nr:hypothetical protein [Propionibacteriaceae bacterium]